MSWKRIFSRAIPLSKNILGNPADLLSLTRDDVLKFINKHYTGGNMVVCTMWGPEFPEDQPPG